MIKIAKKYFPICSVGRDLTDVSMNIAGRIKFLKGILKKDEKGIKAASRNQRVPFQRESNCLASGWICQHHAWVAYIYRIFQMAGLVCSSSQTLYLWIIRKTSVEMIIWYRNGSAYIARSFLAAPGIAPEATVLLLIYFNMADPN